MVRSILLQGVLTERADHLPDRLQLLKARSRRFRQLVASQGGGLTPAQAAIAFGLAEPRIGSILVGVRSESELLENLAAATAALSPDLMFELRQLRIDDPEFVNPDTWQADLALVANRMRAS